MFLRLSGLKPRVFGPRVDIEVREITLSGAEGVSGIPSVVTAAPAPRAPR
ncbi:hypothetical protein [Micromonospora sp. KC207]|nr:hypothetical protein [Micromonospora sp. KC207]